MIISTKRVCLVFLLAGITLVGLGEPLLGQESGRPIGKEPQSPIDALLGYVETDAPMSLPPELRPYKVGRVFLSVNAQIPERSVLGSVGQGVLGRLPVELMNDTIRWNHMLVTGPGAAAHVRHDGVYVWIGAVDREAQGTLAVRFSYYVTMRLPG